MLQIKNVVSKDLLTQLDSMAGEFCAVCSVFTHVISNCSFISLFHVLLHCKFNVKILGGNMIP